MNGGSDPYKPYHFLKECSENFQMHICKLLEQTYIHFHNIVRLFDVLPNFPFTTSETKRDY